MHIVTKMANKSCFYLMALFFGMEEVQFKGTHKSCLSASLHSIFCILTFNFLGK